MSFIDATCGASSAVLVPASDAASAAASASPFVSAPDVLPLRSPRVPRSPRVARPHVSQSAATPLAPLTLLALRGPEVAVLLEGFRLLVQFLLGEEADYLCGATLRVRSTQRVNYRMGYHKRTVGTLIGFVPLRVPHFKHPALYLRVPIAKRAKRCSVEILMQLALIKTSGVTPPAAAFLVKTLWTQELTAEHLVELVEKLTPVLEQWRSSSLPSLPSLPFLP